MLAADFAAISDRLVNWGRWARVHPKSSSACRSLEGAYRSPQCWDPPEPLARPVDRLDAWEIETGVRILPLRHHMLLTFKYVVRAPDGFAARVIRRRFRLPTTPDIRAAEAMARALLCDALALPPKMREQRAVVIARSMLAA